MRTLKELLEQIVPRRTQTYSASKDFGNPKPKKVFPRKSPSSSGDEEGEE